MTILYVDADACPVKEEVYRVAERYGLPVRMVTNRWFRIAEAGDVELVLVEEGLDRADDWIAERAAPGDIVVTADIPLADRAVKAGARVLAPNGRVFSEASIGADLAQRNLMTALRDAGEISGGGPRPFAKQDRSRFLGALDALVQAIRRQGS